MDLRTNYLGLELRTPLVPSASPLSERIGNLQRMEECGAGAVVLQSLFAEQIEQEARTLEEAVRKMSSMPAQRVGLYDRGLLLPGLKADMVVFDPATVTDKATFEDPHQYAEGFSHVLVNGVLVVDDGKTTGARPGKVLRSRAQGAGLGAQ